MGFTPMDLQQNFAWTHWGLYLKHHPGQTRAIKQVVPVSTPNTSLPRFLANGSKPKYAQIKECNSSCNNTCKYINKTMSGLSVTREALIYTLNILNQIGDIE
jgi:hypothetical protein